MMYLAIVRLAYLFAALLLPHDWTTDPVILAWISVASLIVGAIGIIISFLLSYWFYRKGKSIKLITYEITTDAPIMAIPEITKRGKIRISYEDSNGHVEHLRDARFVSLKVQNAGNVDVKIWNSMDIDIENMEEPIEFEFEGRTVVALTQVKTDPPREVIIAGNLQGYINMPLPNPSVLGLPRCLMKSKQSILLGVVLQGQGSKIKVHGKLYNGEIVSVLDLENKKQSKRRIAQLAMSVGSTICLFAITLFISKNIIISLTLAAVSLTTFFFEYLNATKLKRRA